MMQQRLCRQTRGSLHDVPPINMTPRWRLRLALLGLSFRPLTYASAIAIGACTFPGVAVDQGGLGKTPIGLRVSALYKLGEDASATPLINEWFRDKCPTASLTEAANCASRLGMTCPPKASSIGQGILCEYNGNVRSRAISYTVSPSIDGSTREDWQEWQIAVRLKYSADHVIGLTYTTTRLSM